jgi:uncharacterized protein YecE (DUF72 family)
MAAKKTLSKIRVGTASFSDPEWKNGVIYPEGMKPAELLPYYERELGFNCVEIDASYYAIMGRKSVESMLSRTSEDFIFTVKGYKGFCFDPFSPYEKSKPSPDKVLSDLAAFRSSLKPAEDAGRLGCVLLQFPVFFFPSDESFGHLLLCRKELAGLDLVVEFRNKGWAKEETYAFLRENKLGFCIVDGPRIPRLMPYVNLTTTGTGYLRLHGRNKDWFKLSKEERVNYKYSDGELKELLPDIKKSAAKTEKFFIIFNNNFNGYAVKDAERLRDLLGSLF